MYELRPVKPVEQMIPLAKQFIDNFSRMFNAPPSPEIIKKWTEEMVLKTQEAYVKNYLEGFAVQDLVPFGAIVGAQMTPTPVADKIPQNKLTDKKAII